MSKECEFCEEEMVGEGQFCSLQCDARADTASKTLPLFLEIISLELDDTWSKPYYRTSVELWGGDEELGDEIADYSLMEILEPMNEKGLIPKTFSIPVICPDGYLYKVRRIEHKDDYEKLKANAESKKIEVQDLIDTVKAFARHPLDGLENPSTTDNEFRIKVVEGVDILVWKDSDNGQWYLDGCSETFITVDEMFEKLKETI